MKILFLTGPHAVGKSYFMEELANTNKFLKFDTGPEMRKMYRESGTNKKINEWVQELENKNGPLVTCYMLCKVLESRIQENNNIIVTGFRQIEGIKYMIEYFKPEDYEILYIDAEKTLLKSNYEKREGHISNEKFFQIITEEEEWGLRKLKEYILENPEHSNYVKKQTNSDNISTSIFDINKEYKKE